MSLKQCTGRVWRAGTPGDLLGPEVGEQPGDTLTPGAVHGKPFLPLQGSTFHLSGADHRCPFCCPSG